MCEIGEATYLTRHVEIVAAMCDVNFYDGAEGRIKMIWLQK